MYGPQQTGIGTYIQYLLENLAELDRENQYFLFLLEPAFSELRLPNRRFNKVRVSSPWYSYKEQLVLPFQLYRQNLDLMHFTHFDAPLLYFKKSVVTIHDLTPKFFPGHKMGKNFIRRWGYSRVLTGILKKAQIIITPSLFTKNDILKNFPFVKESKIKVIYEGVKFRQDRKELNRFLKNFQNKKDEAFRALVRNREFQELKSPYILYVGVWRSHKNLVKLLNAYRKILDKGLKIQLVLAGKEDPFYPEVLQTIKKLNLKNRVFTPGMVLGEKLRLLYRGATALVLPSLYEGFGLVGLEALSQFTPVVCSELGPLPEILEKGALYFNPYKEQDIADKIEKIIRDVKLQKELVAAGQKILQNYSWRKMAQETLKVYLAALSK